MHTRTLMQKSFRSRPMLAFAGGTLLFLLSGGAQAQTSRSRPPTPPASPSSNGGGGTSHSTDSDSSDTSIPASRGGDRPAGSSSSPVSHDRVDFGKLFPTEKRSVEKGQTSPKSRPNVVLLPGVIFDSVLFPQHAPDSGDASSDKSDKDKKEDNKNDSADTKVTITVSAYDRYKHTQEASAASQSGSNVNNSQILWPYGNISPFWGYTPDDIFWNGCPDPTIYFPAPEDGVIIGWPNYDTPDSAAPQEEPPRDESAPNYRISEQAPPIRPIEVEPVLDAVYRTFKEEEPLLLAYHLPRGTRIAMGTPGKPRGWVVADQLLDRLQTLFAKRRSITLEYEEPHLLKDNRVAVTGWYSYKDPAGIVFRNRVHFILEPKDDRVVFTLFEVD